MTRKATPCVHGLPVSKCRECLREYQRARHEAMVNDPERYEAKLSKNRERIAREKKAKYLADHPGITEAAYDKMLATGRIE